MRHTSWFLKMKLASESDVNHNGSWCVGRGMVPKNIAGVRVVEGMTSLIMAVGEERVGRGQLTETARDVSGLGDGV